RGSYTFSGPPLLIVLGDADPLISAATGPVIARRFRGSVYLLTVRGGQHGGGIHTDDLGYLSVQATVRDFLAAYLYDDAGALRDLQSHATRPHTTLTWR